MPEPAAADTEIVGDVPDRDPIEYRKDGGLNAWVDDRRVRLRPPRLREFRKLLGAWRESLQEMDDMSQEGRDWMDEMARRMTEREQAAAAGDSPPSAAEGEAGVLLKAVAGAQAVALSMTPEERKRDRELQWKMDDAWEDKATGWWALAIETLAPDGFVFDAEALPITLAQMQTVSAAITHWRSVPSRSGGQ